MFTDEKMELKYSETHNANDALQVLLESVFDANNPDKANSKIAVPVGLIKQANNIWKLFANRHPEIKADDFKNVLLKSFPEKN